MAQVVKLKRTAVSGKVPSTSNLELGELAINTYDGRIFFEKDSGTPSIEQVVTTNSQTTGSINLNGNVTASYFFGDGSGLSNISTDIGEVATVTSSFDNLSTINVGHNFNSKNVIVSVYDNNDNQIIPQTVSLTDQDTVQVGLSSAQSGFVVVAKGGHVVSGSADDASNLNGQPASYYLDYSNLNNIPSGIVSQSAQTVAHLSNQDVDLGTGDLTATDITSTNFTINDTLTAPTITGSLLRLSENGTGLRMTNVGAFDNASGNFRIFSNGDLILSTNGHSGTAVTFDQTTKDATFAGNIVGSISATNGVISGSLQITDLTTHKETVSGASSYAVTHNLNEQYPIVQAWNTGTSQQEVPTSITTNSVNQVTVVFSTTFAGVIIVKK